MPADNFSLSAEEIRSQIAALQGQLAHLETPTETVNIPFFLHDGSDARPAIIPDDVRVIYYHADDNALVLTNSNKLKSWAKVTKFIYLTKGQFRTFAKSKSKKAL
jgi:hypothetical protein